MSARDVAGWLLEQVNEGPVYQEWAVWEIEQRFGQECCYQNESGNLAISRAVLREFATLSGDKVVWERGERRWRLREAGDDPGRMQA